MTEQEKNELLKNLSQLNDEIRLLSAEVGDYEKSYFILRNTFVELLEEYLSRRDYVGYADSEEIRYRFMNNAGLLDI